MHHKTNAVKKQQTLTPIHKMAEWCENRDQLHFLTSPVLHNY